MSVTVLGCYINPALEDADERRAQVDAYIRAMPAAHFLGARCIGTETTVFRGSPESRPAAMARLIDSMKRMADEAEKHDVCIGVEPVASHVLYRPESVAELIEKVGSNRLNVIFDPVNLITSADMLDQRAFLTECRNLFGNSIAAIHVKNFVFDTALRKADAPLFQGAFDWNCFLEVFADFELPMIRDEGAPGQNKIEFEELKRRITKIEGV